MVLKSETHEACGKAVSILQRETEHNILQVNRCIISLQDTISDLSMVRDYIEEAHSERQILGTLIKYLHHRVARAYGSSLCDSHTQHPEGGYASPLSTTTFTR